VQVSRICDSCLYLKGGQLVGYGPTEEIQELYERSQPEPDAERSIVLDPGVTRFACTASKARLSWGESLDLVLDLELRQKQRVGLALLSLIHGDTSVAQTDVTREMNEAFAEGSRANLRLGPLNLRAGKYHVVVTILNESRKGTLVHAVNCAEVQVDGPKGYGVAYQMPVSRLAS
jgi:hypothetical protein